MNFYEMERVMQDGGTLDSPGLHLGTAAKLLALGIELKKN